MRDTHVLLWNEKLLFRICNTIVRSYHSVHFRCRSFTLIDNHVLLKGYDFHEMLLWEKHMCYSEMRNFYSGYVTLLLEDGAVFNFLYWSFTLGKTHVLLWNEKTQFGICLRTVWIKSSVHFLCRSFIWKIITFFSKGKNFMICFFEKHTFVTLKWEALIWYMCKYC